MADFSRVKLLLLDIASVCSLVLIVFPPIVKKALHLWNDLRRSVKRVSGRERIRKKQRATGRETR